MCQETEIAEVELQVRIHHSLTHYNGIALTLYTCQQTSMADSHLSGSDPSLSGSWTYAQIDRHHLTSQLLRAIQHES